MSPTTSKTITTISTSPTNPSIRLINADSIVLSNDTPCCCCKEPCSISPTYSNHNAAGGLASSFLTHTLNDNCARRIVLSYRAGPQVVPPNNTESSEPNWYIIWITQNGVKKQIASTNSWVGGTNYIGDPRYNPLKIEPVGIISGIKPAGINEIQVQVLGGSASEYDIACYSEFEPGWMYGAPMG